MKHAQTVAILIAAFSASLAHAEVKQASADGFFLAYSAPIAAAPAIAYADIVQVQRWWNGEHTWSGKAANLSLKSEAGGCFCERWPGGSAEHGRVVMALPGKLLRIEAALGPLQEYALKGILSFWVREDDDGKTRLELEYRVNGSSASGLDELAPQVDGVLDEQFERLLRFIGTGQPDLPAEPAAKPAKEPDKAILAEWAQEAAQEAAAKPQAAPKPKPDAFRPKPAGSP